MSAELSNASEFLTWLNTMTRLNSISPNAKKRFVTRGQVYWCHFGLNIGSEISKTSPRPAIIVQNFSANRSSSNTIVVPVTHHTSSLPCMVPLTPMKDESGSVILDGQVDTAQIVCISKARLGDLITSLPDAQMKKIDRSIAISLELLKYHSEELQKYARLKAYSDKLKAERNAAQDKLHQISALIETQKEWDEDFLQKLREILDTESLR